MEKLKVIKIAWAVFLSILILLGLFLLLLNKLIDKEQLTVPQLIELAKKENLEMNYLEYLEEAHVEKDGIIYYANVVTEASQKQLIEKVDKEGVSYNEDKDLTIIERIQKIVLVIFSKRILPSLFTMMALISLLIPLLQSYMGFSVEHSVVERPDTRFEDVIGLDGAVKQFERIVEKLKQKKRGEDTGGKLSSLLLYGPPGTGKTLLARAIAGAADLPFLVINGSELSSNTFVGIGADKIKSLFKLARKQGVCIVFIDEIDSVGGKRIQHKEGDSGVVQEQNAILNTLLTELDGFDQSKNDKIFLMAATNRPESLDPALLRGKRFARKIEISLPDKASRIKILKYYLKDVLVEGELDFSVLASLLQMQSPADIEEIIKIAKEKIEDGELSSLTQTDLIEIIQKQLVGESGGSRRQDNELMKKVISYHEVGHAFVGYFLEDAADPMHLSILGIGSAAGTTLFSSKNEGIYTKKELLAEIAVTLAGLAGEELLLAEGNHTTGPSGDLKSATKLATRMIIEFGMGDTLQVFDSLDKDQRVLVNGILSEQHKLARGLILKKEGLFKFLCETLLEKESMTGPELQELIENYKEA